MWGRRPSFPGKHQDYCFIDERGLMPENGSSFMLMTKHLLLKVAFPAGKDL